MKIYYLGILTGMVLFSCKQPAPALFESMSPATTHVYFENQLEKKELFGILYYLYYYNGGGVALGDINNDGLTDIYFTANSKGHNKLYLNKGNFQFEDITDAAGVAGTADWCSGATMADVNGDGLLDIYVSAISGHHGLQGHNQLFINNGSKAGAANNFTESAAAYGLDAAAFTGQVAFFDYDHDGDLDCYMLNQSHKPNENIVDTSRRRQYDGMAGDRLYRNDMNGPLKKFTDVSASAGIYQSNLGYGLGLSIADLNNDGWDDIYVGNDFHENDYYYVNNGVSASGQVTFTESGAKHFEHYSRFSMGNDIADYNNDGQLDIVTTDMLPPDEGNVKRYGSDENADIYKYKLIKNGFQYQFSKNCLQQNNGNGISFSETGLQSGISATDWSWCPLLADFDNDGNKDLFISSGIVKRPVDLDYIKFVSNLYVHKKLNTSDKYDDQALDKMPDGASHPFLFKGDGRAGFTDVSNAWGTGNMKGYYNGAAYADLDNDGNLDLVINCINAPALILKNNATKKNSLAISFKGEGMNTSGIGAKAYLFTGRTLQYQQLMLTRGFQSSSEPRLHFGLDSINQVDSILIVWPNQQYQLLTNIPANQPLVVDQRNTLPGFQYKYFFPATIPAFEDISQQITIGYRHVENDFTDFNVQYLLPHMESTRGPKLATADVNKDGLDDVFVCGASGKPGSLLLQTSNGKFIPADTATFNKNSGTEQTAAVFFDANNDGYPDLYVVSGGNEYQDGDARLQDKLYLNRKGHFELSAEAVPAILVNKTCVTVADIDKDGDSDIFIGGFASAKTYGYAQPSYLLLNDGKGIFTMAANPVIQLTGAGMVTSAIFTDINNDGWQDLVLAGEWMGVKLFVNNKGIFKETTIPHSTGLWQTLYATDVNGDGFADILAGNWGHNSKLFAGKNGPLKLYVKDFDKNGSVEQIMAYTINGKEYPFLAKDELERALPVLKKAYLDYNEVAGKTVQFMFFDLFKEYQELNAEVLGSSLFLNDGKGNFTRSDLPDALQLAPVFAFNAVGKHNYIAAGNFYGVVPYEGRYDALRPTLFNYERGTKQILTQSILPTITGEVRDAQWINYGGNQQLLLLARNNDSLVFLKPTNK
ncbi:MAG: VCBS repeat-containing protein [Chitinophagaceae bacterium]